MEIAALKDEILRLTREYTARVHGRFNPLPTTAFVPGETEVPYAGRIFDASEVCAAVESSLDFWLTLGEKGKVFQKAFASYLGVQLSVLVNSGSSANLVALASLTSHKIPAEKRIMRGDEIITCAAGFPTTVAPIVQLGCIPVFVDSNPVTGNMCAEMLDEAYCSGKTKAVMIAHTLGNPFDLSAVLSFCKKHNLWLIEDNCDALGSTYTLPVEHPLRAMVAKKTDNPEAPLTRKTGSWGNVSTQSFYPAHHMTMGEGGCVNIVHERRLKVYAESFRDWGRDCWCESGKENTCNKRFEWKLGDLPFGYDHKYIYAHLGYNLKPLDLQAAIGIEQLSRVDAFTEARKNNWAYLRSGLNQWAEFFDFMLPTHARAWHENAFLWDDSGCETDPSWFGFMMRIKSSAPFSRGAFVQHLQKSKIGNRMLFGGNLVRQPVFVQLAKDIPGAFRIVGTLKGADALMNEAVFLGVYPGLSRPMLDYIVECIDSFVKESL
jgi:CDP-6-deoxy-D-xylo-4-hexulose-3-dehydrase